MIIFNYLGIAIAAAGFGLAFGVGHLIGVSAEGPLMLMAGPLIAIADLVYRATRAEPSFFRPHRGGSLFFLPVWMFGALWTVLGAIYTVRGA